MGIFTNFYWVIIVPVGVIVERLLFKVNFYRFDKDNPLDVNLNDAQPHPNRTSHTLTYPYNCCDNIIVFYKWDCP